MILQIFLVLFTLFVPGFLLSLILLRTQGPYERIMLSFGLNTAILFICFMILTLFGRMFGLGAITSFSVLMCTFGLSAVFLIIITIQALGRSA